jgi:tRNA-dihydrouridine synthase
MNNKKIYIAPMAGVSDYSFRRYMEKFGPDLIFTEMISSNNLAMYNIKEVPKILKLCPGNVVQIFGEDIERLNNCAKYVENLGVNHINLNCGCPMKKIVSNGSGATLLKDPDKIKRILYSLREVLKPETKISLKIRLGYEEADKHLEIAKIAQELKCDHITVHGRTRSELYSGMANWEYIKEVKDNISIPVIGNGDIFSLEDAVDKIKFSGVDGIMLARGVLGNPWLVNQIKNYINGSDFEIIDDVKRIDGLIEYINLFKEDNPIFNPEIRKFINYYLEKTKKNYHHENLLILNDYEELIHNLNELK